MEGKRASGTLGCAIADVAALMHATGQVKTQLNKCPAPELELSSQDSGEAVLREDTFRYLTRTMLCDKYLEEIAGKLQESPGTH